MHQFFLELDWRRETEWVIIAGQFSKFFKKLLGSTLVAQKLLIVLRNIVNYLMGAENNLICGFYS